MSDQKYRIELEERQLRVVLSALDMYFRMGMGQLDVSVDEFLRLEFAARYYEQPLDPVKYRADYDRSIAQHLPVKGPKVRELLDEVKQLVFGHASNASWGVRNEQVPVACREAYDILQVLRRCRAVERIKRLEADGDLENAQGVATCVDMRDYHPTNPEWPPVTICAIPKEVGDE